MDSLVEKFLTEQCVLDPAAMVPREAVWSAFNSWLGGRPFRVESELSARQFSGVMCQHGIARSTVTRCGTRVRYYRGVRLFRIEDYV